LAKTAGGNTQFDDESSPPHNADTRHNSDTIMKSILSVTLIFLLFVPTCQSQELPQAQQAQAPPPISVYFSPNGGCTDAVVKELGAARTTILVQAYSFTSVPIAKALIDAHKRGVDVQVVLDKSQRTEKYSSADFLHNMGIGVRIDAKHAIAHNKVMVIDGQVIITGSFNFTKAAEENNAENLLVIRSADLAAKYAANWRGHESHSEPYEGKTQGYSETHHADVPIGPTAAPNVSDGYVASRNSAVFHKAGCTSAAKISPKNLAHYATRDEAIQAGKKPCHECQP
jgi:phosphatidylserine/phosphatidylglycerophosphate/cardiolipin synthase-like enzyme